MPESIDNLPPATDNATRVHCGIAGWSYPDWNGYVYPRGTKDKLQFIAGYVDAIEINNTFYRPPSAQNVASWVRRTADLPDFFFTAKLHQDITHRGVLEPEMVRTFREGLRPMLEAERLRHLLAQFRYDFDDQPAAREHLRRIVDSFGDLCNLTLELRHKSWQAPEALDLLRSLHVTVANLDYPMARDSFSLRTCTVGDHAYFRLHGRNAEAWFDRKAGRDDTYNYCYDEQELDEIADRAAQVAASSKSLTLIANNHYQGKEAVNALELKARLSGHRVAVPDALALKYPQLDRIATRPRGDLFDREATS